MSKRKVRAAIVGCGMIADFHLAALRDNAEIVGVYDASKERREAFGKKYGIPVMDSEEALWESETELVSVCTPSGTHAGFAVAALRAGKHVAVEKPLALNVADCQKIIGEAKRARKLCAPISQLRFSETVRRVRAAVEEGKLGRLTLCGLSMKYYRAPEYFSDSSWRGTFAMDGGGALMNQGIHGIDLLRFLAGEPVEVQGSVATLLHRIEVEDTAVASLTFADGALGVIEGATSVRPGYPRRIELCGTEGSILMEEDSVLRADLRGFECSKEQSAAGGCQDPAAISTAGHMRQYANILAAIRGEEELFYTAEDAMKTVRLICAIYESSKTGERIRFVD